MIKYLSDLIDAFLEWLGSWFWRGTELDESFDQAKKEKDSVF